MAAPQGQLRVKWYFISLLSITAVLFALVFGTGSGSFTDRLKPRLGLDLQGGTSITLQTKTSDNKPPAKDKLDEARNIIEQRVNATGVAEPEVVVEGDRNIVVNIAGAQTGDGFRALVAPAELRFRQVVTSTPDIDEAAVNATPSPSPSASGSPAPSASPSASASPNAAVSPTPEATAKPSATPSASASAAPSATPAPSGSAAPSPSPTVNPDVAKRKEEALASAKAAVGDANWQLAQQLIDNPSQFQGHEKDVYNQLKPFGKLTGAQVDALPLKMQFGVYNISCKQLGERPPGAVADPTQNVVACGKDTNTDPKTKKKTTSWTKYVLDVASVLGTDVADATGSYDTGWKVNMKFKSAGQDKWTELTKKAYNGGQNATQQNGTDRVAIVLDNAVVSAPAIQGVINGDAQITGSFSREDVTNLAAQLRFGSLPLTFEQSQAQTISPTLGSAQLKAGLLAAGIGMLLVIIYSFFYYRLLGTVIFLSLIMSAILVFGALVLLGRQIGFTLTLAGIAGFIVSLGVAADSFVIYFERLKDEIRDGRSPRSAVPRAWARARRTIISANAISILAAVVLYIFAIGTVQGFAFALGLATVLDLVVVFLFRHPIMAAFASTKAFLSPRVSGLGRVLNKPTEQGDTIISTNPKEA
ncbi:protein translocase subunit SecD [Longispora fulva]|uniref:Protein translocase subunit SecD n=1 Tax=Longispora fulva TaxID=619741 RepID=A0A8J7KNN3_9ACTN|nr:preprotein translocase subunit SecD [Longispora fulva]